MGRVSIGLIPASTKAALTAVMVERCRVSRWLISLSRMLAGNPLMAWASVMRARRLCSFALAR